MGTSFLNMYFIHLTMVHVFKLEMRDLIYKIKRIFF